jgi:hypothetical protein
MIWPLEPRAKEKMPEDLLLGIASTLDRFQVAPASSLARTWAEASAPPSPIQTELGLKTIKLLLLAANPD